MKNKTNSKILKDTFYFIWLPICLDTVISCMTGILAVFCASILGEFADAVLSLNIAYCKENLFSLVVALALTVLLAPVLYFVRDVILVKKALSHDRIVLSRFLNKDYISASDIKSGDMLARLDEDPNELRSELITIIPKAITVPVTITYLVFELLDVAPVYTVFIIVISLVKFIVPIITKKYVQKYHLEGKEYSSKVRSYENEITGRPYLVKLFGLEDRYTSCLDSLYTSFFKNTQKKNHRLSSISDTVNSLVNMICRLLVLLSGAFFLATGEISAGVIAAMLGYYGVLSTIINNISSIIREIPIAENLVQRLTFFYDNEEISSGAVLEEFNNLKIDDLSFKYGERCVFNGISLNIQKGDKLAIVGKNGSGKSTLLKIMLGILPNYEGIFKLNGSDFSSIDNASVRRMIAYAPQDPYIFKGRVLENITFSDYDSKSDAAIELLNLFGIEYLIDREVECGGKELSGGERQKISIIRAIVKDSPIIIIDEPENNLDASSIEILKSIICTNDKTVIIVSHNQELINSSTIIFDFDTNISTENGK